MDIITADPGIKKPITLVQLPFDALHPLDREENVRALGRASMISTTHRDWGTTLPGRVKIEQTDQHRRKWESQLRACTEQLDYDSIGDKSSTRKDRKSTRKDRKGWNPRCTKAWMRRHRDINNSIDVDKKIHSNRLKFFFHVKALQEKLKRYCMSPPEADKTTVVIDIRTLAVVLFERNEDAGVQLLSYVVNDVAPGTRMSDEALTERRSAARKRARALKIAHMHRNNLEEPIKRNDYVSWLKNQSSRRRMDSRNATLYDTSFMVYLQNKAKSQSLEVTLHHLLVLASGDPTADRESAYDGGFPFKDTSLTNAESIKEAIGLYFNNLEHISKFFSYRGGNRVGPLPGKGYIAPLVLSTLVNLYVTKKLPQKPSQEDGLHDWWKETTKPVWNQIKQFLERNAESDLLHRAGLSHLVRAQYTRDFNERGEGIVLTWVKGLKTRIAQIRLNVDVENRSGPRKVKLAGGEDATLSHVTSRELHDMRGGVHENRNERYRRRKSTRKNADATYGRALRQFDKNVSGKNWGGNATYASSYKTYLEKCFNESVVAPRAFEAARLGRRKGFFHRRAREASMRDKIAALCLGRNTPQPYHLAYLFFGDTISTPLYGHPGMPSKEIVIAAMKVSFLFILNEYFTTKKCPLDCNGTMAHIKGDTPLVLCGNCGESRADGAPTCGTCGEAHATRKVLHYRRVLKCDTCNFLCDRDVCGAINMQFCARAAILGMPRPKKYLHPAEASEWKNSDGGRSVTCNMVCHAK